LQNIWVRVWATAQTRRALEMPLLTTDRYVVMALNYSSESYLTGKAWTQRWYWGSSK